MSLTTNPPKGSALLWYVDELKRRYDEDDGTSSNPETEAFLGALRVRSEPRLWKLSTADVRAHYLPHLLELCFGADAAKAFFDMPDAFIDDYVLQIQELAYANSTAEERRPPKDTTRQSIAEGVVIATFFEQMALHPGAPLYSIFREVRSRLGPGIDRHAVARLVKKHVLRRSSGTSFELIKSVADAYSTLMREADQRAALRRSSKSPQRFSPRIAQGST
ncbi:hypothetical protein EMQ25_00835 [Arsenicitalea aurantiaca]|uniref:Uncharacterized protein n=1 Tax=Arsenicitalea aurantiaca TaxID=1783274 RepID=A0A433XKD5_9HYPH|nr:hypothetical protein [Arsenicitalea aurantiaca]RUT34541.1 hypothetical protein EMQ25_00835 [Arsenicitalea aurantiaca]